MINHSTSTGKSMAMPPHAALSWDRLYITLGCTFALQEDKPQSPHGQRAFLSSSVEVYRS